MLKEFPEDTVPFKLMLLKAAQKAFNKTVNNKELNIQTVNALEDRTLYVKIHELGVCSIKDSTSTNVSSQ